ncbi:MAG: excinuclease ABC subunit UvrA [Deferrisomatales bacterium]|nr:excinuclease ABC subunit UvrA [Deferrisomatales bacterium]
MDTPPLRIFGARQNNLTGFDLVIPHDRLVVVTGVSGSGKSSLAFDTVYAEGQWRFLESLPSYTRLLLEKVARPRVDSLENVRPAVALQQHNAVRSARSTVGTATELYDLFRVLFARAGRWVCPTCREAVRAWTPGAAAADALRRCAGATVSVEVPVADLDPPAATDWPADLAARGYARVAFDGELRRLDSGDLPAELPPNATLVLDRVRLTEERNPRLETAVAEAFRMAAAWIVVRPDGGSEPLRYPTDRRCRQCGTEAPQLRPVLFSFNHPLGACPGCNGFGANLEGDEAKIVPAPWLSLAEGAVHPWQTPANAWWQEQLEAHAADHGIPLDVPWCDLPPAARRTVWSGADGLEGVEGFLRYLESKRYKMHVRVFLARYRTPRRCTECGGARLRAGVRQVLVDGRSIDQVAAQDLGSLATWVRGLSATLGDGVREILWRLETRLDTLLRLGLHYLTMDRATRTLSGGEAQRAALALQLQNHLTGTLYVLDEPTVGLHPRDVDVLAGVIEELTSRGNTVLAVEHDLALVRRADHCVEMGPGGGRDGGRVLFAGSPAELAASDTPTGRQLRPRPARPLTAAPTPGSGRLRLRGCSLHNLQDLDVSFPLHTMTCVTGVSGSGKTSLVGGTLLPAVESRGRRGPFAAAEAVDGGRFPKAVLAVDQSPMGRTPRSIPLTYIGAYDAVRGCFATLEASRRLGLGARHFSFNVAGGRCERCDGSGYEKLEMLFFEDLYVPCETCAGRRFRPEVLSVRYRGHTIAEVLELSVDGAAELFADEDKVARPLGRLRQMGLGYLVLGQPAPSLSGGEAQRLKIAAQLVGRPPRDTLFLLDEPTTGLHADDVERLLDVLRELVAAGNTVVAVEHHLELVSRCDWVLDLGPEGGTGGGRLVDCGPPGEIAARSLGATGQYLARHLGLAPLGRRSR